MVAPTLSKPVGSPRRPGRGARRAVAGLGACLALITVLGITSVVGAWRTAGNESFTAKWTDWLRSHHGATVVADVENYYYSHKQPPKGGTVATLNAGPALTPAPTSTTSSAVAAADRHPARPVAVPLIVQPAAAGEGVWQPAGAPVDGASGMYIAQFRADTVYTSQITTAVWIDPTRMHVSLHPGTTEPGGGFAEPPLIGGDELLHVAAAFNGGFRLQDARGGIYLDGRAVAPLVGGAASIVLYRDGHLDIGSWGRDDAMSGDVVAVLQNLTLMVDGGTVDASIGRNDTHAWGQTLRGSIAVARSGIGVTADGALVYVAGPSLTAASLADSLRRAGAVRAMTLDINPEWVTFNFYAHPDPTNLSVVAGVRLYPQEQRSANRYLVADSRDFFTVSSP